MSLSGFIPFPGMQPSGRDSAREVWIQGVSVARAERVMGGWSADGLEKGEGSPLRLVLFLFRLGGKDFRGGGGGVVAAIGMGIGMALACG